MFANRDKIRVDIIGGYLPKKRMCEYTDGKVIIKKGQKPGADDITAEFDNTCLIPYKSGIFPFTSIKHKLTWIEGTSRCISYKRTQDSDAPSCTKTDIVKFAKATVLKNAGNPKEENKTVLYLLLFVLIILGIINLLVGSGNIRLG